MLGWGAGLGWAGLGWAGLGWAGLGCWTGLGWAGLAWVGWAGLGWAQLDRLWTGWGRAGAGPAGLERPGQPGWPLRPGSAAKLAEREQAAQLAGAGGWSVEAELPRKARQLAGSAGLGWARLGWAGLGWVGLG